MYKDLTCEKYIRELSEATPAPAGGGACAIAGAIGTALGHMVGSLTLGKLKYWDVEDEMQELVDKCTALENEFMALVDEDAEGFMPLAEAYKMPADNPIDAAKKVAVMEAATSHACLAPMKIMRKLCEAIEVCEMFADKGNKSAQSDSAVGALLCEAALKGAALSVFANTELMNDTNIAKELNDEADAMIAEYSDRAEAVYKLVFDRTRK